MLNEINDGVGTDFLWNIYTLDGGADLRQRLQAYTRACVEAGPAMDAARDGLPLRVSQGVAIIPIMGPIIRRGGMLARMFGFSSTDSIRLATEAAQVDDDVREILYRVDSPGGSVSGLDQAGDVINESEKPTSVIVEGMAASAAYYLASQADQIFVGKTDLVGSIGTRMLLYDFSKAFEEAGIEAVAIDTGDFKSAGAMGTEITEAQRDEFQRIVNFYFDDFISSVARGRNMTEQAVRELADGRMFTPQQAQESGLIDGISTYQRTLNVMRQRNEIRRRTESARARMKI